MKLLLLPGIGLFAALGIIGALVRKVILVVVGGIILVVALGGWGLLKANAGTVCSKITSSPSSAARCVHDLSHW